MKFRSALLLHGAGGGGWEWNLWRGVFQAAGLQVAAPDLLPVAAGIAATRFGDYLMQASAALAALPRPCVVIGASLGGLLAARLSAQVASPVDGLVLVNPLPPAPWHAVLPAWEWPDVVRWRSDARLTSTRTALPDADPATALFAFRRWRDESGAVLREAHAGMPVQAPACPVLCIASAADEDVPSAATEALAAAWNADLLRLEGSHVGPLLGLKSSAAAEQALAWLASGQLSAS